MEKVKVVLVDKKDNKLGLEEKVRAHLSNGKLHRAFIVFIFNNKGEMLLQKRSKKKMLWPLYWDSSCASHPFNEEEYIDSGERRLKEELGFFCSLSYLTKFYYHSKYKEIGSEKEICAILTGNYFGKIKENPDEVADYRWMKVSKLKKSINKEPRYYTPWFKKGFKIYEQKRSKSNYK